MVFQIQTATTVYRTHMRKTVPTVDLTHQTRPLGPLDGGEHVGVAVGLITQTDQ